MWTHERLVALDLANNIGLPLPDNSNIRMPSLSYLSLVNNGITIDLEIDQEAFSSLLFLYLSGNNLQRFPDRSLKENLVTLGVSRCQLKSLPSYLSEFTKLRYLDARDNNITIVDDDLKALIEENEIESYFSGNENLCRVDKSLDCEPLCSKYCASRKSSNNGFCNVECNDEKCEYDGGDCIG